MTIYKLIAVVATVVLIGCTKNPPEINLSCTGHLNTMTIYNGQIQEKQEPKIVSFTAKAYQPMEKDKNPYSVRIEYDTYDSNFVDSTDDFIRGQSKKDSLQGGKQDEYEFNLNRKTGVLKYSEKQSIAKTGHIFRSFEGNCSKLEKKI